MVMRIAPALLSNSHAPPPGRHSPQFDPTMVLRRYACAFLYQIARQVKVAQAARAVSSPNRRYSNPPSPCTAGPSPFSFESGPSSSSANAPTKFFPHPRSASTGHSNLGFSGGTSGASDGPGGSDFRGSGFKKSTTGNGGFGQTRQSKDSLPSKINVDVVVVGSGAGGGCAAGALAAKGLKVAVLEKGGLYDTADFAGFSEMEAYRELYEGHVRELGSGTGVVGVLS